MKKIALIVAILTLGLMTVASAAPAPVTPLPETAAPDGDAAVDLAVLTGRWRLFFGAKICPGQIVRLPGESQCV